MDRVLFRSGSLSAYGVAILITYYVGPLALDAYNQACAVGDRFADIHTFQLAQPDAPEFGLGLLIIALPVLLARSNLVVKANAGLSLLTLLLATHLMFSARTLPDECVTNAGSYEDHASGLGEFFYSMLLVVFVSYILVTADLLLWVFRQVAHARNLVRGASNT